MVDEITGMTDNLLFGVRSHPYYIWAPRWIEASAGIRCVHYLCDALNKIGQKAYMVWAEPQHASEPRMNAALQTPVLTQEQILSHINAGLNPIAVYPEDVIGNPLAAPLVVRFLWSYAGSLGGPESFSQEENIWAFSKNIALDYKDRHGVMPKVLFVPPVDPSEFQFNAEKRPFQLVYAGKYRSFVGAPPKVGDLPTIEIFRDGPRKQSRSEVKSLLSEATVLYSFENSSIVTEAVLSGTPAGFVSNPFLGPIIAQHELGLAGTFKVGEKAGLEEAKKTVAEGARAYYVAIENFQNQLLKFVDISQKQANSIATLNRPAIQLPNHRFHVTENRIRLGMRILQTKGFRIFIVELFRFVMRFIFESKVGRQKSQ